MKMQVMTEIVIAGVIKVGVPLMIAVVGAVMNAALDLIGDVGMVTKGVAATLIIEAGADMLNMMKKNYKGYWHSSIA